MSLTTIDERLFILQLYGQGLLSKETALEKLGIVENVKKELKRIERELG